MSPQWFYSKVTVFAVLLYVYHNRAFLSPGILVKQMFYNIDKIVFSNYIFTEVNTSG